MRPTLTINTNLGAVILENQVAMMDDLIFPDTSITALTAHHEMVNPVHIDQQLVLDGPRHRQVRQDGHEATITVSSATESQVGSMDTVIPSPPTPTPTLAATASKCNSVSDNERDDWCSLDAMSKEQISDDYVVVDQNTAITEMDDSPVSKANIAAALFKTVAVAAERYSALKGLAAKYFVRCDKTDAPVGPKYDSMGYLILRDSHQFPIPPRHRVLPTAEDRFKHTGAKQMLELLLPDTDVDGAAIDNTFVVNGLVCDLSHLCVIYTEDNQPVISSVELLFTHSPMLREQLMGVSQTFHTDRGLIREICLPLANAFGLETMLETLNGQGYIARTLRGYDDQAIFDKLSEAWQVADTYGFHNCVHHMLDCVLNWKPVLGRNAAWYTLAFCAAANKDNEFAEYLHKKIPPTVVSSDKTTYDFADSLCLTNRIIREALVCPPLAKKHLKTYVPELWSELVVAEAQRKFPASRKDSTVAKSNEPIDPDTDPNDDCLHDHDHDHHHDHDQNDDGKHDNDHLRKNDKSKRNTKHKCRHSATEWETIRKAAADYMFDELVLRPVTDTIWIFDVIQDDLDGCICGVTMYFDMEEIKRRQGGQVVAAMMAVL